MSDEQQKAKPAKRGRKAKAKIQVTAVAADRLEAIISARTGTNRPATVAELQDVIALLRSDAGIVDDPANDPDGDGDEDE